MKYLHKELPGRLIALLGVMVSFGIFAPKLWIALMAPDDLQLPLEHSMRQNDERSALFTKWIALGHNFDAAKNDKAEMLGIRSEMEEVEVQLETLQSVHELENERMREQIRRGIVQRVALLAVFGVVVIVFRFWLPKPIDNASLPEISDKVSSIRDDPDQKDAVAVKAYYDETGLSIREGKAVIESSLAKQSEATL